MIKKRVFEMFILREEYQLESQLVKKRFNNYIVSKPCQTGSIHLLVGLSKSVYAPLKKRIIMVGLNRFFEMSTSAPGFPERRGYV